MLWQYPTHEILHSKTFIILVQCSATFNMLNVHSVTFSMHETYFFLLNGSVITYFQRGASSNVLTKCPEWYLREPALTMCDNKHGLVAVLYHCSRFHCSLLCGSI